MEGSGQTPAASSSPFAAPQAAAAASDSTTTAELMRAAMLAAQASRAIDAVLGDSNLGPSSQPGAQDASGPPAPVSAVLRASDAMDLSEDLVAPTPLAAAGQAAAGQAVTGTPVAAVSVAAPAALVSAGAENPVGEKRLREDEKPAGSPAAKMARTKEEVASDAALAASAAAVLAQAPAPGAVPPTASAAAPGAAAAGAAAGAVQNASPFVTEADIIESHRQLGLYAGFDSPAKLKEVAEAIVAPDLIPPTRIPENINTLRGPGGRFASKTPKEEAVVEAPKRRRKRNSMQNGNQWSEEENLLFLQGLQTFGRKFSRIHSRFFPYRSKQAVVCRFSYLSRVWADCRDASVLAVGHPLREAYLKILPPMETENFIQRRAENERRIAMGLPVPAKPAPRSPAPAASKDFKPPRAKKVKEKRPQRKKVREAPPPRRTSSGRLRKRPARLKDHTETSDVDVSDYEDDDDDDETFRIADGFDSETDSDSDCYSPGNDVAESPSKQPVAVPLAVAKALEQKLQSRPSLTDSTEGDRDEAMADADADADADAAAAAQVLAGVAPHGVAATAEDLAVAAVLAAPSAAPAAETTSAPSQEDIEAVAQALMKGQNAAPSQEAAVVKEQAATTTPASQLVQTSGAPTSQVAACDAEGTPLVPDTTATPIARPSATPAAEAAK